MVVKPFLKKSGLFLKQFTDYLYTRVRKVRIGITIVKSKLIQKKGAQKDHSRADRTPSAIVFMPFAVG